ncbi:MAG: hypothetical protein HRU20_06780 [Pseudomonadales bacterium]|nr:hypothetical protein [Pseudomonadales bacterium]
MNNATRIVTLGFSVLMLASCDWGGSKSSTDKTFSVSLENVDIRRVSNGETVDIDTAGISSGQMILKQK